MIQHVALIMDGNRRWAKKRGLPAFSGHTEGYKRIEDVIRGAKKHNISHITFWAFSTENWKRDEKEVIFLINLFRKVLHEKLIEKFLGEDGKAQFIGDISKFPKDIQDNINNLIVKTKDNKAITVTIALNYGGRDELKRAVQNIVSKKINYEDITEEIISHNLDTKGMPDPDLIIRTGGEQRLSGYLPWQGVYSELYFCDTLWPDFNEKEFDEAIEEYKNRNRRFGT